MPDPATDRCHPFTGHTVGQLTRQKNPPPGLPVGGGTRFTLLHILSNQTRRSTLNRVSQSVQLCTSANRNLSLFSQKTHPHISAFSANSQYVCTALNIEYRPITLEGVNVYHMLLFSIGSRIIISFSVTFAFDFVNLGAF